MILKRTQIAQNVRYGSDFVFGFINTEAKIEATELKINVLTAMEHKLVSMFYRFLDAKGQDGKLGKATPLRSKYYNPEQLQISFYDNNGKAQNYQSVLHTTWRELSVHYFGDTKIGSNNLKSLKKGVEALQKKTFTFKFKVILAKPFINKEGKEQKYKFLKYTGQLFERIEISENEKGDLENDELILRFSPPFTSYITQSYSLFPSNLPERLEYGYSSEASIQKGKLDGKRKLSKSPEAYNFVYYMANRYNTNKTEKEFPLNLENLIHITRLDNRYFKQKKKADTKKRLEAMVKALIQTKILKSAKFEPSRTSSEGIKLVYVVNPKWLNETDLPLLD